MSRDPLQQLYPFLHGKVQSPESMDAALAESLAQKVAHHAQVMADFFSRHGEDVIAAARTIAGATRHRQVAMAGMIRNRVLMGWLHSV